MSKFERLDYIDIFRGIALLIMVSIQIFDYLSVSNIYTTKPYYVETINSVTWVPPSLLFTFVSGMSVFLLVQKLRQNSNLNRKKSFLDIVKRYGKYILISLPFTLIMWNISIFLGWEEAIQGIGLTAIFLAGFLLIFFSNKKNMSKLSYIFLILLIVGFAFLSSKLPSLIDNSRFFTNFPRTIGLDYISLISVIGTMFLNAFFRGWFSIVNLFPIMLGGILMLGLIRRRVSFNKMMLFSLLFLFFSIFLHLIGYKIDYYGRSFSFTFFAIGESALICSITYLIYNKIKNKFSIKIFDFLKTFGLTAFFVYIVHYLLILKVLQLTGLKDILNDSYSILITIPLVFLVYVLGRYYLRIRMKLPRILRL